MRVVEKQWEYFQGSEDIEYNTQNQVKVARKKSEILNELDELKRNLIVEQDENFVGIPFPNHGHSETYKRGLLKEEELLSNESPGFPSAIKREGKGLEAFSGHEIRGAQEDLDGPPNKKEKPSPNFINSLLMKLNLKGEKMYQEMSQRASDSEEMQKPRKFSLNSAPSPWRQHLQVSSLRNINLNEEKNDFSSEIDFGLPLPNPDIASETPRALESISKRKQEAKQVSLSMPSLMVVPAMPKQN